MFIAALFITAKTWKQPNVHPQMTDKQKLVSPHSGILFSLKKKELLTQATIWINLEGITPSEISQTQKPYAV